MKFKKIFPLLLCASAFFIACNGKSSKEKYAKRNLSVVEGLNARTDYYFNLFYDNKKHQLAGTMKAKITNYLGKDCN